MSSGVAARADGPHELRPARLVDDDHGEPGPDGDDRLGLTRVGRPARATHVPDGTDQGGRDQVDALDGESRPLDHVDHSVDQVDVGRGHQHPAHLGALVVGVVGEHLGGQDRLVRREGDDLFGLEPDGAVDLVVGHVREVDLAGDGPQAGDADDD
jgi:hypothetical protein